ncbi:MAG: hypothetical protein OHK0045_21900 [Raineya sp.]
MIFLHKITKFFLIKKKNKLNLKYLFFKMKTSIEELQENGFEAYGIYNSIYPAVVADNNDPEGLARIKIKVPSIFGGQILDNWALPFGVAITEKSGLLALPQLGDNVWVMFQQGNLQFPLWTYGAMSQSKKISINSPKDHLWQNPKKAKIELKNIVELNGNNESAVLGDTLSQVLGELIDAISALQVICTTPGNPSGAVVNIAQFQSIKTRLNTILSQKVKLS